jgi:predicted nuclease with TOPRIM domain
MSDLVARLRDADTTRRIGESYADTHERRQRDRNEAAAEIERLNRELDDVWDALAIQREDNGSFGDAFKRQAAEIERLQAALDRAADRFFDAGMNDDWAEARAALAEEAPCSSS